MRTDHGMNELLDRAVSAARELTGAGLGPQESTRVYARTLEALHTGWTRRPRRWALAAAGTACVVTALVLWIALDRRAATPSPAEVSAPRPLRVVYSAGDVRTQGGDHARLLVPRGTVVAPGAEIVLGDRARMDLDGADRLRMAVFGPGRARWSADGRLRVTDGQVACTVDPRPGGTAFRLVAGEAEIVVTGTRFDTSVQAGRLAWVRVAQGVVEVRSGETFVLRAGEAYHAPGVDAPAPDASNAFDAPWWWRVEVPEEPPGHLSVETRPPGARVRLGESYLGITPLLVLWPAGDHALSIDLAGHEPVEDTVWIEAGDLTRRRLAMVPREASAPPSPTPGPTPRPVAPDRLTLARAHLDAGRCDALDRLVRALLPGAADRERAQRAALLAAECRLRKGDKAGALAWFEHSADLDPASADGETALFECARLLAETEKPEEALATIQAYLVRHPRGRFAEAAGLRRCELLIGLDRLSGARRCLAAFAETHERGMRADLAVILLGDVERREGRWAQAADRYLEHIRRAPGSPRDEMVRYRLVQCGRWGQLPGLRGWADAYLERYPDGPHAEEVRRWRSWRRPDAGP